MKVFIKVLAVAIVGALAVYAAYIQRGYGAVGGEWFLPIVTGVLLFRPKKKERRYDQA